MIFYNCKINGININNNQYKISQFAYDTTLFLDDTRDSLKAALNTLETFGTLSGLVVNKDNTKLVWLGETIQQTSMILARIWFGVPLNYLCLYFTFL